MTSREQLDELLEEMLESYDPTYNVLGRYVASIWYGFIEVGGYERNRSFTSAYTFDDLDFIRGSKWLQQERGDDNVTYHSILDTLLWETVDPKTVIVNINVDGIETTSNCDNLFKLSSEIGDWKHEKIYINTEITAENCKSIIQRKEVQIRGSLPFDSKYLFSRFTHIAGSGGNGKTQHIVELAKAYPNLMYTAPTHEAVNNIKLRAKEMGVEINVDTYHRVFGINCRDHFPRKNYTHFILDECSMLSATDLTNILSKLTDNQGLMLSGDFCQLQPIDGEVIYDNWSGECTNKYNQFEKVNLTKNWRQKADKKFFKLCQSLRKKMSVNSANILIRELNTRVTDVSMVENDTVDDIHVCGINTQVNCINDKYSLEIGTKVITRSRSRAVSSKLCSATLGETPNGAGTELRSNGVNTREWITKGGIGVISSVSPFMIVFNNVEYEFKSTSNFTPAHGLTVHKAQGKTIKRNVIINPSRLFSKNHLYVALTRAVKFSNVYFTEPITLNVFKRTVNVV